MNLFALSGILIGVSSIAMAVLMLIIGKERLHYIWSLFCVSVAIWGFGAYGIATTQNIQTADLLWRLTHIGVIFIPILFTHFVYGFLKIKNRWFIFLIYALGLFFLAVNLFGKLFIANMRWVFDQYYHTSPPGILYIPFTIFFFGLVFYAHYLLWLRLRLAHGLEKTQIQYFLSGMAVSFSGGSLTFLIVYGIDFYPIFNLAAFLYTPILTYAIVRKQLFGIKVFLTQLLVGAVAILLSIQLFTGETAFSNIWSASLLIGFLIFGYFLVKSVIKEIEQREKLEMLAVELGATNKELTKLDAAKSEFISLASHQLRSPLTVIKGYLSLLMEGTAGKIEEGGQVAVTRMNTSVGQLGKVVDELLDLARMESGRLKYNLEQDGFAALVQGVISDLRQSAEKKNVKVEFNNSLKSEDHLKFDRQKMKEAITHLVENAIKYSYEGGKVAVTLEETPNAAEKRIRLSVKDDGIGISEEIKPYLFTKFTRAPEARRIDPNGFGIGLYFVKRVIEDHGGKVWVESEGEGKGSMFGVEVPIR